MWLFLSLVSALFLSFRRVLDKRLSGKLSFYALGWAGQFFCLPAAIVLLFFTPIPDLTTLPFLNFWLPLFIIWFVLYPVQIHFYFKSINEAELSLVLPLLSMIPVFNVGISSLVLREFPSMVGLLGIFAILVGVFILNKRPGMGLKQYFTKVAEQRASLYMIIASASIATGSTLDKLVIQASHPLFYNFMNTLGATVVLFVIATLRKQNDIAAVRKHLPTFLTIGAIYSVSYVAYLVALSTGFTSYVVAVRSTNTLIASYIGMLMLGEQRAQNKTAALIVILLGLFMISQA